MALRGTLDIGYYSQYISSMSGATAYDKSDFQESFTLSLEPVGLYFSAWDAYSPNGSFNGDFGDEIDYTLGIKRQLKGFTFNAGYAFYNMYNLKNVKGDLHGIFLNTQFPKVYGITPFLNLEKDIPDNIGEGGFLYRAGLGYTINIAKQPLDMNFSLAGHDGAYGKKVEAISSTRFSLATDIKLWKFTITPAGNFQRRLGHSVQDGGMTENKIWYGVNVSLPLF